MVTQTKTLKLGAIDFINYLPFALGLNDNSLNIESTTGSPASLNQALREGVIDAAAISSYEYLKHQELYYRLPSSGISSKQAADSVLLLIKNKDSLFKQDKPIVHLTNKSASSSNLTKIILAKKYKLDLRNIEFKVFTEASEPNNAKLLIGDEALLADQSGYELVLDLGNEWFELTKLPMVFAVWAVNKDSRWASDLALLDKLVSAAWQLSLDQKLPDLIVAAYKQTGLNKKNLLEYFSKLDYQFSDIHLDSLKLFESYLKELDLL